MDGDRASGSVSFDVDTSELEGGGNLVRAYINELPVFAFEVRVLVGLAERVATKIVIREYPDSEPELWVPV